MFRSGFRRGKKGTAGDSGRRKRLPVPDADDNPGQPRRVPLRVIAGPCRGFRVDFDLIRRQEGSYLWGSYDRAILQQLSSIIRPGWTVWDCGTYLGFYT